MVPVDYCAEVLAQLLLAPTLRWDLYHISAGEESSDTFAQIDVAYARANGTEPIAPRFRKLEFNDIAGVMGEFRARLGDCNRRLVAKAMRLYGGFADLNYTFSNARTVAEGCSVAPRLTSYIDKCVATSNGVPLGQLMLEDFK